MSASTIAKTIRLAALTSCVSFVGCSHNMYGRMQGQWVLIGSHNPSAGEAAAPRHGSPLAVNEASGSPHGCFSSDTLDKYFGKQCDAHETEGAPSPVMTDELQPGLQPTPGEVRWYCDRQTAIRVVIDRCEHTNTFRVNQIAVTRQPR